jgi:beta-lactamase superfamily II metal-dependent hydrolase
LAEIFDCATVNQVWENGEPSDTGEGWLLYAAARDEWGGPVDYPAVGDSADFGAATATVLNTMRAEFGDNQNDNSITIRLEFSDFAMLVTADAEEAAQQKMADTEAALLDCDVIDVPSHGLYPFSQDFIDALHAQTAIVSVDSTVIPDEYPDPQTLAAYEAAGMDLYLTEDTGNITIRLDEAGGVVLTFEN